MLTKRWFIDIPPHCEEGEGELTLLTTYDEMEAQQTFKTLCGLGLEVPLQLYMQEQFSEKSVWWKSAVLIDEWAPSS